MDRKIKLIWDFRGPSAQKTAAHHVLHLKEYSMVEKIQTIEIAVQNYSEFAAIAFMIVHERDMLEVRDALKPHRAEVAK